VVAKGIDGVNKHSKNNGTPNLLSICGEFTQMVMVTKVLKHGIPCLSLELECIPWATTLDVACIGPISEKSYILWICNYLIDK
jgi:hypothetical protein